MSVPAETVRIVKREKHRLPAQRWRIVIHVIDQPEPGETHLSLDELKNEFERSIDLPAGITYEYESTELLK